MEKLKLEALGRMGLEDFQNAEKLPLVVVLDQVRSMHNVGAIFRTADGFALSEVVLCGITPRPPHREIFKVALGATESVAWRYFEKTVDALTALKEDGYTLVGIEQTTESTLLDQFGVQAEAKYALVLGNEVDGLSEEILPMLDHCLEVPMRGTKHSLNVSVCGGIVLWEFFRHLNR